MAVDADHVEVRQLRGAHVDGLGVGYGDAELVFLEARGDVRVGAGVDVRVHAQRHRRDLAHLGGHHLQALELVGGLDVEAVHPHFQGAAHVFTGLADPGEHHAIGAAAGGQHAFQFTAGDDVEARAQARQQVQHAQVGVGLDREADQVIHPVQGIGVAAVLRLDMGTRVHVGGRSEAFGDRRQGHPFREQLAAAVVECIHGISLLRGRLFRLLLLLLQHWLRLDRLGMLVRLARAFAVLAVFRQVQGAFLTAGRNQASNRDHCREGGNQAFHG